MDAFSRPECLPNTRQVILKFITDWLTTPSGNENILWLHAVAGFGKSTISTTLAESFRELERLGAFIFFNRNTTSSDPAVVIRTLSYQLSDSTHPSKLRYVLRLRIIWGLSKLPCAFSSPSYFLSPLIL
jgi:hypothetical protein